MREKTAFENGRISNLQGLVTLTLDQVILHTVMYQSSTSTYIPNFIEIEGTFCGRTDGHLRPTLLGRLGGVDLKVRLIPKGLSKKHLKTNGSCILRMKCFLETAPTIEVFKTNYSPQQHFIFPPPSQLVR